eukprot:5158869-Prymnesium_polylepis.1
MGTLVTMMKLWDLSVYWQLPKPNIPAPSVEGAPRAVSISASLPGPPSLLKVPSAWTRQAVSK